ncbi:MAG: MAPEG family protein [Cellvibrionaceae bacterium]|nr:MAPEG family protein [Cellvibrionaceae bacterium]
MLAEKSQLAIFTPFLGMMLLTLVVWLWLFVKRLSYATANNIHPEAMKTPADVAALLPEANMAPAHNLANLAELPIVFYGLCLYLFVSGQVDSTFVTAAYVFLITRALHSIIHCTYNKVMHRFVIYVASCLALWFMVVRAALQVL